MRDCSRKTVRVGIHQPNLVPWFPFFYKMAMCDYFIIYTTCQFEKNNFQNRFQYKDKWITKSVARGTLPIYEKIYTDGSNLVEVNMAWIEAIRLTLGINCQVVKDLSRIPHGDGYFDIGVKAHQYKEADATDRLIMLIENCKHYEYIKGDVVYITNREAKEKYLNEVKIKESGIGIEYCQVPRNLRKSTFEIFEEFGIDGAIRQLPQKVTTSQMAEETATGIRAG